MVIKQGSDHKSRSLWSAFDTIGVIVSLPQSLLEIWQHTSASAVGTVVVPDGCRDVILHALPGQRPAWFVTELADCSYVVPGIAGKYFLGFRMQPGVQVDEVRLLVALKGQIQCAAQDALPVLEDCTRLDPRVRDALHSLSGCASVAAAARQLGVSERTLQRLVHAATGRPPAYWKCLARLRRAAVDLPQAPSLAECAADHGYTDQAHMTHEFGRWLGRTPVAVLASTDLLEAVAASGYR